jgi:hypothetical protein
MAYDHAGEILITLTSAFERDGKGRLIPPGSGIGDPKLVIDMIVGDTQRVMEYPQAGFAAEQPVPEGVHGAYRQLVEHGFTGRLIKNG